MGGGIGFGCLLGIDIEGLEVELGVEKGGGYSVRVGGWICG